MPLFINGSLYTEDGNNLVLLAQNLGKPKFLTWDAIDSKNKVKTCLQREYVIKGENSSIEYLGTGGMDTCIAIFIQNSYGESFLAHSDIGPNIPANRQLVWGDIFSKFIKKDQIFNVMLLGGYQPELTEGDSLKKMQELFGCLHQFANGSNFKINLHRSYILKLECESHFLSNFIINCKTLDVISLTSGIVHSPSEKLEERKARMFDIFNVSLYEAYNDTSGKEIQAQLTFSDEFIQVALKAAIIHDEYELADLLKDELRLVIPEQQRPLACNYFLQTTKFLVKSPDTYQASKKTSGQQTTSIVDGLVKNSFLNSGQPITTESKEEDKTNVVVETKNPSYVHQ